MAWVANPSPGVRLPTVLAELLSTITSPAFSDLVITVARYEARLPWAVPLFRELHVMNEVRRFKLVFFLKMLGCLEAQRKLAEVLHSVTALGLLDFLDSPPTIRMARPHHYSWDFLNFN